jgi:hypothetical protein
MVVVEGVGYDPGAKEMDSGGDGIWWGENLYGSYTTIPLYHYTTTLYLYTTTLYPIPLRFVCWPGGAFDGFGSGGLNMTAGTLCRSTLSAGPVERPVQIDVRRDRGVFMISARLTHDGGRFSFEYRYGPHTYGPGTFQQFYFLDPEFPDNMEKIWQKRFGFLSDGEGEGDGKHPVVLGEFGGFYRTNCVAAKRHPGKCLDELWQDSAIECANQWPLFDVPYRLRVSF